MGLIIGCAKSTPVRTVQDYLVLLSGEREATASALEAVTTENYRRTEHPHIASVAREQRSSIGDLAQELGKDPAIREFLGRVKWVTDYRILNENENDATVEARIIITEKRKGDREKALKIKNLPQALVDVLENGFELPFQFELKMENGRWKVDNIEIPDELIPMIETTIPVESGDKEPEDKPV
ncbi:MAG: hypothetical protein ABIC40_04940 [bacterium]